LTLTNHIGKQWRCVAQFINRRKRGAISMNLRKAALVTVSGLIVVTMAPNANAQQGNNSFTGTVQRVWEDGFRLNTGNRTIRVDSWDLCGDATARYINVGDQLTVTGEFEWGEFDAMSITRPDGEAACS